MKLLPHHHKYTMHSGNVNTQNGNGQPPAVWPEGEGGTAGAFPPSVY
jgi:hypothetical protein